MSPDVSESWLVSASFVPCLPSRETPKANEVGVARVELLCAIFHTDFPDAEHPPTPCQRCFPGALSPDLNEIETG